jgi:hypothetical protein
VLGCRFRQRRAGGRGSAGLEDGGAPDWRTGGIGPQIERVFVMGIWGRREDLSVWVWERCGDSTAGWLAVGTGPAAASRARSVPFTLS